MLGGVTLLSSGLLVNAVFMVLTPEPSALGMRTAAGSGSGEGGRVGRMAVLFCLGGPIPSAGVISLTSGLLASFWSHGISWGSCVEWHLKEGADLGKSLGVVGGRSLWLWAGALEGPVSGDLHQLLPLVSCGST